MALIIVPQKGHHVGPMTAIKDEFPAKVKMSNKQLHHSGLNEKALIVDMTFHESFSIFINICHSFAFCH